MSTKAQYLVNLAGSCEWVSDPVEDESVSANSGGAIKLYNVTVLKRGPKGVGGAKTVGFYVTGEGGGSEEVLPRDPTLAKATSIYAQVETFVRSFSGVTRPKVTIDKVDVEDEWALLTAYEIKEQGLPTERVVPVRYFVYKSQDSPVAIPYAEE